ncbi:MAG: tetratricopeptide repeat protein [Kiritimatiellales bacterium]
MDAIMDAEDRFLRVKNDAEQGRVEAQTSLGCAYIDGDGVEQDIDKGIDSWRKAAERGFFGAQYNLGEAYYEGVSIPQNYVKAEKWLRRAAVQGFAEAQIYLGHMCAKGIGIQQDYVEAYYWVSMAGINGLNGTEELRADLMSRMTTEQRSTAIQLVDVATTANPADLYQIFDGKVYIRTTDMLMPVKAGELILQEVKGFTYNDDIQLVYCDSASDITSIVTIYRAAEGTIGAQVMKNKDGSPVFSNQNDSGFKFIAPSEEFQRHFTSVLNSVESMYGFERVNETPFYDPLDGSDSPVACVVYLRGTDEFLRGNPIDTPWWWESRLYCENGFYVKIQTQGPSKFMGLGVTSAGLAMAQSIGWDAD